MFIVEKKENEMYSLPARELPKQHITAVSSELAQKILALLAQEPGYPSEIAKSLKVHEQKVYYHIRNLEKAGVISVVRRETKQGAVANYYAMEQSALVVRFREFEASAKV